MNIQEYFNTPKGAAQKAVIIEYCDYVCDVMIDANNKYKEMIDDIISSVVSSKNIKTDIHLDRFCISIINSNGDSNGDAEPYKLFGLFFNDVNDRTEMSITWYGGIYKIIPDSGNENIAELFSSIAELLSDKGILELLFDMRKKWMSDYRYNANEILKCNAWLANPDNPFPLGNMNLKM